MEYKESKYNFLYPHTTGQDGDMVIYNARTTSLSIMDKEHAKMFTDFCNGIPIADKDFEQQLFRCGCILPTNIDEQEILQLRLNQTRFNSSMLALTIAPTMNCNFRCVYCFEANSLNTSVMSEEVQQAIIDLAKRRAKTAETMNVVWYGGEPLLALDIIEKMSKQLIQIAEENNIPYNAIMVTNGYFLTKEIAQKLTQLKVNSVQITVDGPKHVHDKRRVLAGGQGTFDKIISNLAECWQEINNISLRINTDKTNEDKIDDIVHLLKEKGIERIYCYLGFVTETDDYSHERCLTMETFGKKQFDFSLRHGYSPMIEYPLTRANYCSADYYYNFLIDPEGLLYNCWNDIGNKERSVGSLFDDERANYNLEYYNKFLLYDPTVDPRCSDCKLLPVCMGGCPYRRIHGGETCTEKKYVIEEYILSCVKYLVSQQSAQPDTNV